MIAIIGLGNPGSEYRGTRHNLGFAVLDDFYAKHKTALSSFAIQTKFKAETTTGELHGKKIILAKPQTFMNLSGDSINALRTFYKLALENIWVIHDDLDLPVGKLRISIAASAGGHNGISSIINKLGSDQFVRFRVGIGRPEQQPVHDFVLRPPDQAETERLSQALITTTEAVEYAIRTDIPAAQNTYNQ